MLNGQAAVEGIISSLSNPTNPTAVADWKAYLQAFDNSVDGKYAISDTEIRLLANVATWKHAQNLEAGTQGKSDILRDRLPMDRFRASANVATAIAYAPRASNLAKGYIAPV